MSKYYYHKDKHRQKLFLRLLGIALFACGLYLAFSVFFPIISWNFYYGSVFANADVATPIPKMNVLNTNTIQSLLQSTSEELSGVDYTNAQNWFPAFKPNNTHQPLIYTLSIPKLGITHAKVATTDYDLKKHLVNFPGTAVPPEKGNAVIFGHSTLPQLFNQDNYSTIFANLHTMQIGDTIVITIGAISYTYKIFKISIINPDNMSVLAQRYDDSYLTIITCTPPGTTWKRLVLEARLEKI